MALPDCNVRQRVSANLFWSRHMFVYPLLCRFQFVSLFVFSNYWWSCYFPWNVRIVKFEMEFDSKCALWTIFKWKCVIYFKLWIIYYSFFYTIHRPIEENKTLLKDMAWAGSMYLYFVMLCYLIFGLIYMSAHLGSLMNTFITHTLIWEV